MPSQPRYLSRTTIDPDPVNQLNLWLQGAEQAQLPQPNAMTLATVNNQRQPSARVVLLRGLDRHGLEFFTNYQSRKGEELLANPQAALLFCWLPLGRQVRVEGRVEQLSSAESDRYFAGRPRGHQLAAQASAQSRALASRAALEQQFREVSERYAAQEVPRPLNWGGYRLVPEVWEFWQEGEHRLHDRLRYRQDGKGAWLIERLSP